MVDAVSSRGVEVGLGAMTDTGSLDKLTGLDALHAGAVDVDVDWDDDDNADDDEVGDDEADDGGGGGVPSDEGASDGDSG